MELDKDIVNFAKATRRVESGDDPKIKGGSNETGYYQYTPATWNSQAKKYGINVPIEQATPEQQNEVFYKWAKEKKDAGYNLGQISSMHNAGEGKPNAYKENWKGTNKYGVQYDTPAYAKKVAEIYQELKATTTPMGIEQPVEVKKTFMEKTGNILDSIFGGGKIGEAIGTSSVKSDVRAGVGPDGQPIAEADYSKLSPEAILRLQAKGVPTTAQGQREEVAQSMEGPNAGQIAGDVARIGVNFLPAGMIAKGGAKAVPILSKLPPKIGNIVEGAGIGTLAQGSANVAEGRPITENLGTGALLGGATAGILPPLVKGASKLVKNITQPIEKKVEGSVLSQYKKGVKPLINAKMTISGANKYDDNVITGVKTIKDNKTNLSFVDDTGEVVAGETPKTLQQFSDSIEQTKKVIFNGYDELAKKAGKAGVQVNMKPIADELDTIINNRALSITNPNSIKYAKQLKARLLSTGNLDATTAQDVVQNYNKSLEAFYRNPSYETATQASIDAMIANNMRKALDDGISGITGAEYGALKRQYGALKAIEKDVIKATLRDARKNTKGLIDFSDILSGGQVVSGLVSLNPGAIASGLTQKGIASFYKYLNNPNRAIEKMFKSVDKLPSLNIKATPKVTPKVDSMTKPKVKPSLSLGKVEKELEPLAQEARKYKSAEEFATSLSNKNVGEFVQDIPIDKIRKSDFYQGELAKAQKEIASGTYKRTSDEPIRLFFDPKKGDFEMVDGYHRLAKAIAEGKNTMKSSIETVANKSQLTDFYNKAVGKPSLKINKK